ncbi:M28 family metallopeptidase [Marinicella sp. W31]|uniref:M28 family metallopeptidase n=1 Tax=Marinicella sp. W31 TaxID=3023713 RepID=UPI003756E8C6
MKSSKLVLISTFLCICFSVQSSETKDLYFLNIDKIGLQALNEIKQHQAVDWWLELGDKMVIAHDPKKGVAIPGYFDVVSSVENIDGNHLAVQSFGHCGDSNDEHAGHFALKPLFSEGKFNIVSSTQNTVSSQLFNQQLSVFDDIAPLQKNSVLSYQFENRNQLNKSLFDTSMDRFLQLVDGNRWYEQVEFLSGLNRQLEPDLIIAGEWIEQKYKALGLTSYRVDYALYRGFSVVGFKSGTTRPDDWYVVGAHLDSRNQDRDDTKASPGAEDNASGCSGVMEIANVISQFETEASIMFMCFAGHEGYGGSGGSRLLISDLEQDGTFQNIKAMLNLDMISYRRGDSTTVLGSVLVEEHLPLINQTAQNGALYTDLDWRIAVERWSTDYVPFAERGVPATTSSISAPRTYFGYHTVNDLAENLDPDFATGVIQANLATLAQQAGVDLSDIEGTQIVPAHSGLWYDPGKPGHGVTVEVLEDNRILAIWYTYNSKGQPAWLLGQGTYEINTANLDVSFIEQGAFPPSDIPDNLMVDAWGNFTIEFQDCTTAQFNWMPNDAQNLPSGSMTLKQLSRVAGLSCESTQ